MTNSDSQPPSDETYVARTFLLKVTVEPDANAVHMRTVSDDVMLGIYERSVYNNTIALERGYDADFSHHMLTLARIEIERRLAAMSIPAELPEIDLEELREAVWKSQRDFCTYEQEPSTENWKTYVKADDHWQEVASSLNDSAEQE
jgi:hypothetical protein